MKVSASWIDMGLSHDPMIVSALASMFHFEYEHKIWHHTRHWSRVIEYPWACLIREPKMTDVLLDAGAGEGTLAPYLSNRCERIYALDTEIDPLFLNLVKKFKNLQYIKGDISHMPLPSESIDKAFCISVLEHSKTSIPEAVKELMRVTKTGGSIMITADIVIENPFVLDGIDKALGVAVPGLRDVPLKPNQFGSYTGNHSDAFAVAFFLIDK